MSEYVDETVDQEPEPKKTWEEVIPMVIFKGERLEVRVRTEKNQEYLFKRGRPVYVYDPEDIKWFASPKRNGRFEVILQKGIMTSITKPKVKKALKASVEWITEFLAGKAVFEEEAPKKEVKQIDLPFAQFLGARNSHRKTAPSGRDYVFSGNAPITVYNQEDFQFFATPTLTGRYKVFIKKGPMTRERWELDGENIKETLAWAKTQGIKGSEE